MEEISVEIHEPLRSTKSSNSNGQNESDEDKLNSPIQEDKKQYDTPENIAWMYNDKQDEKQLAESPYVPQTDPQKESNPPKLENDEICTKQNEKEECIYCPGTSATNLDAIFDPQLDKKYNTICFYCSMMYSFRLSSLACNFSNKYCCTECQYSAENAHGIFMHYKTHLDESTCTCNSATEEPDITANNMPATEKSSGKLFQCSYCTYSAKKSQVLKRHMITHTGERPHQCKECPYRAPDISSLRVHSKIHSGERPFKCNQCPYRATQKSTLRTHFKVHTGEKPYSCSYCSYKSSNQTNLGSHIKTHTGEKPYSCPYCSYCSTQSSAVKCHLRTHTGEKPYLCPKCPYRAAALGNLKSHTKVHKDS